MIDLDVTNESSASWDKLSFRKSSVERLGTRTTFSSSDDSLYCTVLLTFLGLDRVALVAVEGLKIGSSGLGLRRRAIVYKCAAAYLPTAQSDRRYLIVSLFKNDDVQR